MNFIRRNVFLAVLIGVVIVGGVAMMLVANSSDLPAQIAQRTQVSADLERLAGSALYTKTALATEQDLVNLMKQQADQKVRDLVKHNRSNFQVPRLKVNVDGKIEEFDAFPFDLSKYQQYGMYFVFTKEYVEQMGRLRQVLHATSLPTQADLRRKQRELAPLAPTGAAEDLTTPPTGAGPADELRRKIIDACRLEKASAGLIYAADDSFDVIFSEPVGAAATDLLWNAMINLWVQSDLAAAIAEVNEESVKGRQPCVMNAAIKRLVKLEVQEQYVRASDLPGLAAEPSSPGPSGASNIRGGLTTAGSCKDYDVVRYAMTVVMPTRHLLTLEQNLMKRNLHTVLDVTLSIPPEAKPQATSNYLYGPEPVMQVTISGQLLLLTDWERGTWDAQRKEWGAWNAAHTEFVPMPPLVPKEVLRSLPPSALRPEDADYIKQ